MNTIEIPRDIMIGNHEAFWERHYPGDPEFRSKETLWQLATEKLTDAVYALKDLPFSDGIPYKSLKIVERRLPSLRKGLNETEESFSLQLYTVYPSILNRHPIFEARLGYRQKWTVKDWPINRPYQYLFGNRSFKYIFHPDTLTLTSIKEDKYGADYWQRLKAPLLQASALYLLVDLLTDSSWHQPTRIDYRKP